MIYTSRRMRQRQLLRAAMFIVVTSATVGLAAFGFWSRRRRETGGERLRDTSSGKEDLRIKEIRKAGRCEKDCEDLEEIVVETHRPLQLESNLRDRVASIVYLTEDAYIPPEGVRVYVKTYGCSHNMSDSEIMKGVLQAAGFQLTEAYDEADAVIVNSCTVKNPSESSAVNFAQKCKEDGKYVVIAGCVLQADRSVKDLNTFSVVGVKHIDKIGEALLETMKGNRYQQLSQATEDMPSLALPKIRRSPLIDIIAISGGCLGSCTYCKTKFARGHLSSYSIPEICAQVKRAIREGVQQIWLSSEDTGAYGLDVGTNIVQLLEEVLRCVRELQEATDHHVMIRLGMTNPPYILDHLEGISAVLNDPHFFKFIHIPVQSGSNEVLKEMNREYTRKEFEICVDHLREHVHDITIATDFICGFPGEKDEDHNASLTLIKKYKFPVLNISQYYRRPGTAAAGMAQVPSNVRKERSVEMTNLFSSYQTYNHWVGKEVKVWFEGYSEKSDHVVGHTEQYIKVLTKNVKPGEMHHVKVIDVSKWHLLGEVMMPVASNARGDDARGI